MPPFTSHTLKTWPAAFTAIWEGRKAHEWRRDDRHFAVDDLLVLREWEPRNTPFDYSGRVIVASVNDITRGPDFDLPVGFCAMTIVPLLVYDPLVEKWLPVRRVIS